MPSIIKNLKGNTTTRKLQCQNLKKTLCRQDVKACKIALKKKRDFELQLEDLLQKVREKPAIYNNIHLRPLRKLCEYSDSHRDKFPGVSERSIPLEPTN